MQHLVDVMVSHAEDLQDAIAFTFLSDGGRTEESISFAELDAHARRIAAGLQETVAPGERVVLLYPSGLDFVTAFFGCFYAGTIAVPAYPPHPAQPAKAIPRVQRIIRNSGAKTILTTADIASACRPTLGADPELQHLAVIATDALVSSSAEWRRPSLTSDSVALLQYTSGSTGEPKGVIVTHGNLLHNQEQIRLALGVRRRAETYVSWLPLYHDMGLIGHVVSPACQGSRSILMPPLDFLTAPHVWLEAISRHQGTTSGGPNSAWELCVQRIAEERLDGLDLSSWQAAYNGSEPIHPDTLRRFARKFARCGFRQSRILPCYGLAESSLIVSGGRHNPDGFVTRHVNGHERVGCGRAIADGQIVIVDPQTRTRVLPQQVGEVWVSSPSVTRGYWNHPAATEHAFGACIADEQQPFLRTGDLGFIDGAGELFITGRLKDLIIIDGRNVYPQDLERAAEHSHPLIRVGCAAAFPVVAEGSERPALVAELKRTGRKGHDPALLSSVIQAIRSAVLAECDVALHAVVLATMGAVPKGTSGKIRRRVCRELFESGALETLAIDPVPGTTVLVQAEGIGTPGDLGQPNADDLRRWLMQRVAAQIGVAPARVDPRKPIAEYGLASRDLAALGGELGAYLGAPVSPTLLWEHPTIDALVSHLGRQSAVARERVSVARRVGADEPIAIIGVGCRFPSASGPREFWSLLRQGIDATREVPGTRWHVDAAAPSRGGFLDDIDLFDADLFRISPREANRMDPQQRLLLEVAWEALEDAAIPADALTGSSTGVFIGVCGSEYGTLQLTGRTPDDAYAPTGSSPGIVANRLSYAFDWNGPSVAVDTACSSSLVAVHLACESLRRGESTLALAGGVSVMLLPEVNQHLRKAGLLSPDGRCKAFGAAADGYGRGEGIGVVVLKPASRALADGDRIIAVLRATAVAQDGRTNGLTAPSLAAQRRLLRSTYQRAGMSPAAVQYVEAHGTGTKVGDLVEATAIGDVLGGGRARPCTIGSVKSNIGHLEAAAGIAGLIKVALALRERELPPSLHAAAVNPDIPFADLGLAVQSRLEPWPEADGLRVAAVSSFGFGGTIAHAVLEEPGHVARERGAGGPAQAGHDVAGDPQCLAAGTLAPLLISARDPKALRAHAQRWAAFLEATSQTHWTELVRTAAVRRSHLDWRASIDAHGIGDAVEALSALAQGRMHAALTIGEARPHGGVVFVFPGQGGQWPEMGRTMLADSPAFAEAVAACDAALLPHTGWSVVEVLRGEPRDDGPPLDRVDVVQPALFAMAVGLAAAWRDLGVTPSAVVGYSQGEIAAAVVAGALSLEHGARIVATRSRLLRRIAGRGGMAIAGAHVDTLGPRLSEYGAGLSIAAVNTPTSTVISGDRNAIDACVSRLTADGVFCRRIDVDYASHSEAVDALLDDLAVSLAGVSSDGGTCQMVSTVTGEPVAPGQLDAEYWCRNLREPVRLDRALTFLRSSGRDVFIEVGPHPVLAIPLTDACVESGGVVVGSLRRGAGLHALMRNLGALHVSGHHVEWARVLGDAPFEPVPLPTYAFQRQRYWLDDVRSAPDVTRAGLSTLAHPFLGAMTMLADGGKALFTGRVSLSEHPWLADHQVFGSVVLPGAAVLEMVLAAGRAFGSTTIAELTMSAPVVLPERGELRLQVLVAAAGTEQQRRVAVYSSVDARSDVPWTLHATGTFGANDYLVPAHDPATAVWPPAGATSIDLESVYGALADRALVYGPAFRGLVEAWRGDAQVYARVELPPVVTERAADYALHPALLDAALHALIVCSDDGADAAFLPFCWSDATLYATGATAVRAQLNLSFDSDSQVTVGLTITDPTGQLVATVRAVQMRRATAHAVRSVGVSATRDLYRVHWQPVLLAGCDPAAPGDGVRVLGERRLAERLGVTPCRDLHALVAELDAGLTPPSHLVIDTAGARDASGAIVPAAAHVATSGVLTELQALLADARLASTSVTWLTHGAIGAGPDDAVPDLTHAPLWGLIRTARREHTDRVLRLVDIDANAVGDELLWQVLAASGEPELAVRRGTALAARLVHAESLPDVLAPPSRSEAWRLDLRSPGSFANLRIVDAPEALAPLDRGQVRVAVRAAGVNFLDVCHVVGLVSAPSLGVEFAGVVLDVGEGVTEIAVGDRVMGLGHATFATVTTADARWVTRMLPGMSFVEAATIPVTFLTALYALRDLAAVQPDERVLVHAAAGGVGMAAVQLARHLGVEVFGTASPSKWRHLRAMGLGDAHIASSRDGRFADAFAAATGGAGVDVVLNCLAGDFIDASLRLLPRGGRFLELGKTDIRDAAAVRRAHPGVEDPCARFAGCGPRARAGAAATSVGLVRNGRPVAVARNRLRPAARRGCVQVHGERSARGQAGPAAAAHDAAARYRAHHRRHWRAGRVAGTASRGGARDSPSRPDVATRCAESTR